MSVVMGYLVLIKKTKVSKGFRHAYKQRVMELVDIFPKAGGLSKEGQNSLGGA
jgi:hypothetical protein